MKVTEARKYVGKAIRYKCDRSRRCLYDTWYGVVEEVVRSEVRISGDWINLKGLEVVEEIIFENN